jgi:hypothetical protein
MMFSTLRKWPSFLAATVNYVTSLFQALYGTMFSMNARNFEKLMITAFGLRFVN